MRQFEDALESDPVFGGHSQVFQSQQGGAPIEKPKDNRFSMQHRDHGDAHIYLASGELELDSAVLGKPFLGDVQAARDLQA